MKQQYSKSAFYKWHKVIDSSEQQIKEICKKLKKKYIFLSYSFKRTIFVICLHFDSLIDNITNAKSSSAMPLYYPLIHGTFYENF
jgi:hypothetical protein